LARLDDADAALEAKGKRSYVSVLDLGFRCTIDPRDLRTAVLNDALARVVRPGCSGRPRTGGRAAGRPGMI